jgi:hypothetical protein
MIRLSSRSLVYVGLLGAMLVGTASAQQLTQRCRAGGKFQGDSRCFRVGFAPVTVRTIDERAVPPEARFVRCDQPFDVNGRKLRLACHLSPPVHIALESATDAGTPHIALEPLNLSTHDPLVGAWVHETDAGVDVALDFGFVD